MSDHLAARSLTYPLRDGYVVNWLVAGPQVSPERLDWDDDPGIEGAPVERGPLGTGEYRAGEQGGVWAYYACPEDHVVDRSGAHPPGQHLRSRACAELVAEAAGAVILELTASGAAGLWLDGALTLHSEGGSTRAPVRLNAGVNRAMIRFEDVAAGETTHTVALRIQAAGVSVQIPTLIENVGRRAAFEALTAAAFVERDVYEGGETIVVRWPDGDRAFCPAHVRLHGPDDAIYALADTSGEPGASTQLGYAVSLPAGPLRVTLMPGPDEVYLDHIRVTRDLPFWSLGRQRYTATPSSSDPEKRRTEALLAVAERTDSLYGQIARLALGARDEIDPSVITRACERPDEATLAALVGMLHRFGATAELGEEATRAAESAVLGYDRWSAPGPEASRILRHAAETLAGQRYPDRLFADGQPGARHRDNGERLALAWMSDFAARGSAQPGAGHVIEREAAALASLADLAASPAVYEMAAVCLDKLLFLLALHSLRGTLGAASPAAPASYVTSGLLQPTAPISRMLWGTGIYNHHLVGVLSLALATEYEPPAILEAIALQSSDDLWSRERHAPEGAEPVGIVTYKTPEYALSSLTDLRPDTTGDSESVWRATLGPETIVFVNQPGSSSESDSRLPGYWAGALRLPAVGQWHDALIALHRVAEADPLPWTHAYFPCAAFDEYTLRDGWAFARVGDGYLALTCSTGITLTTEGRYARRELRAFGPEQAWLVQLGRAALDGDFATFQAKVTNARYASAPDAVRWQTIRGDELHLASDGSLLVNGAPQRLPDHRHLDSPYATADLPCAGLEIRLGDDALRLDFQTS